MNAIATYTPIVKFNGYNFCKWYHDLKIVLNNEHKLYILKNHVPEQPPPTSWCEHDAWWKHHCDALDVSELMLGTVIPIFQKDLERYEAYEMFHQIKHIHKQKARIWFKPNKLEESHMVNSLFPKAQERKTNDNSRGKVRGKIAVSNSIPKKSKKDPNVGSCFYCGKTGHWKRHCPAYLNETMKYGETSTSGI